MSPYVDSYRPLYTCICTVAYLFSGLLFDSNFAHFDDSSLHCVTFHDELLFLADEAEDPAAIPVLWISKWVDYTDKYGLGKLLIFCPNFILCFD